jgi:hypothetical protein
MAKSSFYTGTDYDPSEPPAADGITPGTGNDSAPSSFYKGSTAYDEFDDITASAAAAEASAAAAAASAAAAAASATAADTSADAALVSETAADASADAAAASAVAAAASAAAALVSETAADASADAAAASAVAADASADAAAASAVAADASADAALVSETAAAASASAAATSYDAFDDRYLGSKVADPALDNDGNALLTGALYFNTVSSEMRVYNGASWDAIPDNAAGLLAKLLTVDGAGSGLDADLLDGQSSAYYATATSVSDHLSDAADAHDASAISVLDTGANYTATDVEAALAEVMDALQAHEADTADAHDASAISFVAGGNLVATDVQAAIDELDDEKQPLDADLTAIAALTTTAYGRSLLELADEAALEATIDTLANLTSVQGRTVTLADAGANAIFGWDDTAGAYENLTQGEVHNVIGTLPVANGGTGQTTEAEAVGELIQALTADTAPDYTADYIATYDASADTGKKVLLQTAMRDKLTANRTYYVRTDGSNSNNGLADSAGGAWLTWDYAVDFVVANLDLAGYTCTIQCGGSGSRTFSNATVSLNPWTGGGTLQLLGNTTTPSEVTWDGTGTKLTATLGIGTLEVKGFTIASSNGYGLNINGAAGRVNVDAIVWGTCNNAHITMFGGLLKEYTTTITGNATHHINLSGPTVYYEHVSTLTISGTPAFSGAYAKVEFGAVSNDYGGYTSASSATGVRYDVSANGILNTYGSGATYLPGSTAGSTATQGQYI